MENVERFQYINYILSNNVDIIKKVALKCCCAFKTASVSQLKLDHQGKLGSTGRPFRLIVGLLVSRDSNPGPTTLAPEHLTDRLLSRHPMVNVIL